METADRNEVWFDVGRLVWQILRKEMSGIQRVELAYASWLLRHRGSRCRFVAWTPAGGFGYVPHEAAADVVTRASECWKAGTLESLGASSAGLIARCMLRLAPLPVFEAGMLRPAYINISTWPFTNGRAVGSLARRTGAAIVPMVHDLIPLEFPEYVPPSWTANMLSMLDTISRHADGVLCNSQATADSVVPCLPPGMPVIGLPLGVEPRPAEPPRPFPWGRKPFFLMLGTIEARKNHIGLLHAWRDMASNLDGACPHLVIVGRRGWENPHVFSLLDRSAALAGHVSELGRVSDSEVSRLMAGARALLMPSFAEGYGLPVAEALAAGLPVICSDLLAHREIAGHIPEYLDPVDGAGWTRAVLDYAAPDSPRRAAQVRRMPGWSHPTWEAHVGQAVTFAEGLARKPARTVAAAARIPGKRVDFAGWRGFPGLADMPGRKEIDA